jgi:steroid delta-isomerase-like uncharacterized protein
VATDELRRKRREDTLLALIEAENALDIEKLLAVFPHPRYELIGTHKVYDGRDQVERHLKERRGAFPDYRSEVIAHYHCDDAVIAEVWMHGTHLGPIENIAPSGRGFRCRMAVFFLFEDDRLVCERVYFDQATIARQIV